MLKLCLSFIDLKPIHYPNFLQNFFLCHQNMTIDIWIIFSFMYFSLIFVDQNKFSILLFFFLWCARSKATTFLFNGQISRDYSYHVKRILLVNILTSYYLHINYIFFFRNLPM